MPTERARVPALPRDASSTRSRRAHPNPGRPAAAPRQPRRIRERDPRFARARGRRHGAAAGRRLELRLRQHRGLARRLAGAARALRRRGRQDQPPRDRRYDDAGSSREVHRHRRPHAEPAHRGACRSARAAVRRSRTSSRSTRSTSFAPTSSSAAAACSARTTAKASSSRSRSTGSASLLPRPRGIRGRRRRRDPNVRARPDRTRSRAAFIKKKSRARRGRRSTVRVQPVRARDRRRSRLDVRAAPREHERDGAVQHRGRQRHADAATRSSSAGRANRATRKRRARGRSSRRSRRAPTAVPIDREQLSTLMDFYAQGARRQDFEAGIEMALRRILASPEFVFRFERVGGERRARRGASAYATSSSRRGCRSSSGAASPTTSCSRSAVDDRAARAGRRCASRCGACSPIRARTRSSRTSRANGSICAISQTKGGAVEQFPELRRQPAAGLPHRDRDAVREHRSRGPQRARSADRRLHVRERAPRAPLRHPGRLRQPVPPRASRATTPGAACSARAASSWSRRCPSALRPCSAASGCSRTSSARPCRRRRRSCPRSRRQAGTKNQPRTRARADGAAHRERPFCAGCHKIMDPIGFALENFDAIGQWRTEEHGVADRRDRHARRRHATSTAQSICATRCSNTPIASCRRRPRS